MLYEIDNMGLITGAVLFLILGIVIVSILLLIGSFKTTLINNGIGTNQANTFISSLENSFIIVLEYAILIGFITLMAILVSPFIGLSYNEIEARD